MALPAVAEMKKSFSYQDPGDVAAPVSPEEVPVVVVVSFISNRTQQ